TVPVGTCDHPDGDTRNIFEKLLGLHGNEKPPEQPPPAAPPAGAPPVANQPAPSEAPQPPQVEQPKPEQKQKKRGFWRRLFGGGDKNEKSNSNNQDKPQ